MVEPAPNTEALDQQFKEFIQAVKQAVATGIPHIKDDPKVVDQAIADCKEILDVVMEGDVKRWLS
jgi:hypothetical protein